MRDQLLPQFDVVEDFAIEGDNEFVAAFTQDHRLHAAREVDNAQPRVSQSHRTAQLNPVRVRPAMIERCDHCIQHFTPDRLPVESLNSRDATHARALKSLWKNAAPIRRARTPQRRSEFVPET